MVDLSLSYLHPRVFNLSRQSSRDGVDSFMPERMCDTSLNDPTSIHVYYDGVSVKTQIIPSDDEYAQLLVDVSLPVTFPEGTSVALSYKIEHPVVLSFRCAQGYSETLSIEGGVSRELRRGDAGYFEWCNGEYLLQE